MPTDIKVPPMGESIAEATLLKWHKNDGEFINADEPIAEMETDKANTDVPATASGIVRQLIKPGTLVKVGQVIATVDPDAKPNAASALANPTSAPQSSTETQAPAAMPPSGVVASATTASPKGLEDLSPATRRAVSESGVDPSKIPATGPNGRLTKEDVEAFVAKGGKAPFSTETVRPEVTIAAPVAQPKPPELVTSQQASPVLSNVSPVSNTPGAVAAGPGMRRAPMSKIRKRIAENLVKAKQSTAMLTTFNEVDLGAIQKLRATYKEPFEKKHGIGLGFMSFFVRAACVALQEFERVNGQIDGDDIILFDHVHMGVAVSTERGLTVPVLKNAHTMSFAKIESEIKRVAIAARDGKLGLDELSGGTFTITNGGIFGSLLSTPIINTPQSAILGMHSIKERPVAVDGKVEIRPMMYLALSYDHRIIDGKESVTFLVRLKQLLEDPTRLMLDV